ncbi:hypothetical protein [Ekhidna sp.]|uniref:hypothetical protein n=1 Tax=Ekhidna sp. TaxID=2608089 RepID=UPI003CCC0009
MIIVLIGCTENPDVPNHTPGVVKVVNGYLMVTYGEGGLVISNEISGEFIAQIFPSREMNSIDDFDVDGDLIFLLDTRGRDFLAVYSIRNEKVEMVNAPIAVEGGPFNGISAKNGNLIVSGGTTFLERFTYSSSGKLSHPITFGRDRGHPDVLLSSDGQAAFVSTDFGIGLDIDRFGVMSLFIGDNLEIPSVISELGIPESGFTTGVTTPVGFPIQTDIYGDHLLVAHGSGLTIIRLIDNYVFQSASFFNTGIDATSITIADNNAFIIGFEETQPVLIQIDLSDINNPRVLSQQPLQTDGSIPTSIAIGTNDIYIAAGSSGLLTLPLN